MKERLALTDAMGRSSDMIEKIVPVTGSHNCGGRCLLKAHVRDGRVIRISSDDFTADGPACPQLRGCMRCLGYRERLYHPDRLLYPLKRTGKRGEGKFERITWEEALDITARQTRRIMHSYGPEAIYFNYGTGNAGRVSEKVWMTRLLGLYGGYLSMYGNYSNGCSLMATPYTYGTAATGSSREDWVNSRLIILLGWNPAEVVHGTNTMYYLKKAKEAGARIVVIDPLYSNTAVALADQWVPIRPTTDSALLEAMAYVMIQEGLQDQAFLDRYCLGFDEAHLPENAPAGSSYRSYLVGDGEDRTPKTPAWAEAITGIPRETIVQLAREYASNRPGALIQGYGPQRHAYGEQVVRSGTVLAAMTGNVGVSGGWASGLGAPARSAFVASIPNSNPCPAQISHYIWTEAVQRGAQMGRKEGVRGVERLSTGIKLIYNLAGNCLVNQHSDANATATLLSDESLVEFILVNDQFMTASAKFADIILPADNMLERDDILLPWAYGDYVLFSNKAIETVGECRNGYDWVSDLAARLGVREAFTEGRSLEEWLRYLVAETARRNSGFPSYEAFKAAGIYRWRYEKPDIAFRKQIEEPEQYPFPTPSGKIEIFSPRLQDLQLPESVPAIPKYIPAEEGPTSPLASLYPLQCVSPHYKRRVHSIFDNVGCMEEAARQELWMNTTDAAARGLRQGERVRVFNSRGTVELPVKITPRMMPGVVSLPQGAWWSPDENGVDQRGCANTLTGYRPTPLAFSNSQHTCLVQVEKVSGQAGEVR